jgi:cytochrome c
MLTADFADGDPEKGRSLFTQSCSGCHSVGRTLAGGEIGPNLEGVYGRKVGSLEGYNYSKVMAPAKNQLWDRVTINLFISDAARYFPGTTMTAPPVGNSQDRRDIVGFLKSVSQ